VVVAVVSVRMVEVPANQIIDVIGVRNRLVPAARSVYVAALSVCALLLRRALYGVACVGLEAVLVHMIAVNVVHVAFVKVIGVAVVLDCGVPTVAAVGVAMSGVGITSHGASLVSPSSRQPFSGSVR
jgi:hypothetical protein